MTTFETVVLGIISSLIATFVFLGLAWITKHALIPWLEDKIYRGVRIDGRWRLKIPTQPAEEYVGVLEVVQSADSVSGTYSHEDKETKELNVYRINGHLANAYLNAAFTPLAKDMIDTGALVVHVFHETSLKMSGVLTYISSKDGGVESHEVILEKSDS